MTVEKLTLPRSKVSLISETVNVCGVERTQAIKSETAIGVVAPTWQGNVMLQLTNGPELFINAKEARELSHALSLSAYHAENRERALSAFYVPKVAIGDNGVPLVTYGGQTGELRLSKLRKPRRCDSCRKKSSVLWIPVVKRAVHFGYGALHRDVSCELCQSCIDEHSVKHDGLRLIGAGK